MAPRSRLSQIVGGLANAANAPDAPPLAVAYSAEGETPEVVLPPVELTESSAAFAAHVLGGLLDRFGAGGLTTVGVLAPAARETDGLGPCLPDAAEAMLVCAAERGIGGSASAAIFRPNGQRDWHEAHEHVSWICAALRALVSEGPLESGEAGTLPSASWDADQMVDDDGDAIFPQELF